MIVFQHTEITSEELFDLLQKNSDVVLIDVREEDEFNLCKINGSINLPLRHLVQNLQKIEQEKPLVTICHHGVRSMQAAILLKEYGFNNVASLKGGLDNWATTVDLTMPRY